ncbi:MAG: transporter substrate-binding protein [Bacteroidota bacterium]|nr:transporter substrate-binding protein [Bacteroidota bacterium]
MKTRRSIKIKAITWLVLFGLTGINSCNKAGGQKYSAEIPENTVRIGVLFSKTGNRAITELSMRDAAFMAVEEINNEGGLLGKQVELIDLDAESDDNIYKGSTVQLINKYRVTAVFCNLPTGTINYVIPKLKRSNSLLFDLSNYSSATATSTDIIRLGSSPDQLLLPGTQYLLNLPKQPYTKFYLLGTANDYSNKAHNLIRSYLINKGVPPKNIKERIIRSESEDFADVVVDIKRFSTDGKACVLNTSRGSSNLGFYKEFANQGLTSLGCPIMAFSISEDELRRMDPEFLIGHLFCRNYFQSVDTEKNIRFVSDFKLFCAIQGLPDGIDRVTGDGHCQAYTGVYLWKRAVEKAGSFDKEKVKKALYGLEFNSPAGIVKINEKMLTLDKPAMVGESNSEGQIDVLWQSDKLIPASPLGREPDLNAKELQANKKEKLKNSVPI